MRKIVLFWAVTAFVLATPGVRAADAPDTVVTSDTTSGAGKNISPSKKALIQRLLTMTEAEKNAKMVIDTIFLEQEKQTPALVERALSVRDVPASELPSVREKMINERRAYLERFRQMLDKELKIQDLIEEVFFTTYDKHFTEPELNDLITFYGSPTGKKAITSMPQIAQESMDLSMKFMLSKMKAIEDQMKKDQSREAGDSK